jgi:hypothetical protein
LVFSFFFSLHTWLLEMVGLNPRQQHNDVTHKKKAFPSLQPAYKKLKERKNGLLQRG